MKIIARYLIILLAFHAFGISLFAQSGWHPLATGTDRSLYGLHFLSAQTGTIVSDSGEILHTTDGGLSWERQESGIVTRLTDVFFVDEHHGTAVGDLVILHTSDGGKSWQRQITGPVGTLWGAYFHNADTGIVIGSTEGMSTGVGIILRTTDAGEHWRVQDSGTGDALFGLSFADPKHGLAVGGKGTILRTTDGGITWKLQQSGTLAVLFDVSYIDSVTAIAVGNDDILGTTDGGEHWTRQVSLDYPMYGVHFTDRVHGTAVGFFGVILHTSNGGMTWNQQDSSGNYILDNIEFVNDYTGFASGSEGTLLRTENAGGVWTAVNIESPYQLQAEPSPAISSALISFTLPSAGRVNLSIYNDLGEKITTLVDGPLPSGRQSVLWNTANLPSGPYYYRLVVDNGSPGKNYSETKKILLTR
ncbi:MAG: YCF48-related protein [Bacteroidota bacterium]